MFSDLSEESYFIVVKDNETGCTENHTTTLTLTSPVCPVDADGDGYAEHVDADDNNACIPDVGSACIEIDNDNDGRYANYPDSHPLFDINDNDACLLYTSPSPRDRG